MNINQTRVRVILVILALIISILACSGSKTIYTYRIVDPLGRSFTVEAYNCTCYPSDTEGLINVSCSVPNPDGDEGLLDRTESYLDVKSLVLVE